MNNIIKTLLLCFFLMINSCSFCSEIYEHYEYPDFEQAMRRYGLSDQAFFSLFPQQKKKSKHHSKKLKNKSTTLQEQFAQYKSLYDNGRDRKNASSSTIPRIIHQIWIGKPMPEKFNWLVKTWENWSGWEHKLWTDKDLDELPMINRKLYDAATNYGEKADIARLEILRLFGGIYVDMDLECLQPAFFYDLTERFTFAASFDPLEHSRFFIESHSLIIGNAFLAAEANSPLINLLITNMESNFYKKRNLGKHWDEHQAVWRTGPIYLTEVIKNNMDLLSESGIIFPPTFTSPILGNATELPYLAAKWDTFIRPETSAIHYWSASWIKETPRHLEYIRDRD